MVFLGFAIAIGGLIGLNWSVIALFPVTAIMAFGWCIAASANGASSLPSIILAVMSLQGGYMIGLTGRNLVGSFVARLNARPSKPF
jgi:hypothetical protein